jgi:hypothetical protein
MLFKVSTLRFSSRMMNVSVEPAVNEIIDPMVIMFRIIKKKLVEPE